MAATIFPSSSGGILVVATGAFAQPRVLLVPVGARLPRGVHAVAAFPAAPLAAAPGSGRRGAIRSVTASAGSEAAAGNGGDDDDYEMTPLDRAKKDVIEAWDDFERRKIMERSINCPYEMVCFDKSVVGTLQMNAWRGANLVASLLVDLGPEGMWEPDLNNQKEAGMSFLRVALQAQHGYVRASSVREAAHKLEPLYAAIISSRGPANPPPAAKSFAVNNPPPAVKFALDAPSPMVDPSSYYKGLIESVEKAINAVQSAFVRKRCGLL